MRTDKQAPSTDKQKKMKATHAVLNCVHKAQTDVFAPDLTFDQPQLSHYPATHRRLPRITALKMKFDVMIFRVMMATVAVTTARSSGKSSCCPACATAVPGTKLWECITHASTQTECRSSTCGSLLWLLQLNGSLTGCLILPMQQGSKQERQCKQVEDGAGRFRPDLLRLVSGVCAGWSVTAPPALLGS